MSTTPRFSLRTVPSEDNTARQLTYEHLAPAYAATVALKPIAYETLVLFGQLTGALTVTAAVTAPQIGDKLNMLFATDGTQRVVTFGTGFLSSGTVTIPANKKAGVTAIFDGAAWHVVSREISA